MFFWQTPRRFKCGVRASPGPSPTFHAEGLAVSAEAQPVRSPRPIVPRANEARGGAAGEGVRP